MGMRRSSRSVRRVNPHIFERNYGPDSSRFCLDVTSNGVRKRSYFPNKTAAKAALKVIKETLYNEGGDALMVSHATRIAAVEAEKALEPYKGATIAKAVEHYIAYLKAADLSVPVQQMVTEFLAAKAQNKELSKVHTNDLKLRYRKFCETFGDHSTRTLTTKEVEEWIWNLPLSDTSKNNYRNRLVALFNFGIKRGYVAKGANPVADIDTMKVRGGKKPIFSVDQLRAVLDCADPELIPAIVIGAFAGVRTKERTRLTWEDIDIKRGKLTVGAEDSKTAARRTITMEPCLQAWLAPFHGRTGPIFAGNDIKFCLQLRKTCFAAGLKNTPKNGLRHSFASYHVAKYNDAERVRGDLGHSTADLLFRNYRELVQPEDAERYFNLFPVQPAQNVVVMSVA
jgi:integrase